MNRIDLDTLTAAQHLSGRLLKVVDGIFVDRRRVLENRYNMRNGTFAKV